MKLENKALQDPSNYFSCEGLLTLLDHVDRVERQTNMPCAIKHADLHLEFAEYPTALEAAQALGYEEAVDLEPHGSVDLYEVMDLEETQALDWLREQTIVIPFDGGVIVANF